jgi:hypothetical protein
METSKKTYYDWLFTESKEEELIKDKINEEDALFQNTKLYKIHRERLDDLYKRLFEAQRKRLDEAKEHAPNRKRKKNVEKVDLEAFKRENEEKHKIEFEAYPEPLKKAILAYNDLNDDERRVFQRETWCYHCEYEDYKNPQTTEDDLRQLLEILVQTVLDFINERGLKDIDEVSFGADSLQESAKFGHWVSSTDASIHANGFGTKIGKDGKEYRVLQKIGEYM